VNVASSTDDNCNVDDNVGILTRHKMTSSSLGTNVIDDFTAVTFSMKSGVVCGDSLLREIL